MGLKHEAKKGTVIEVNGVTIKVLRGSPHLEITAPREAKIKTSLVGTCQRKVRENGVCLGDSDNESRRP